MIKSNIEKALCKVNRIPEVLVEELRMEGKTIICQLKQPTVARCPTCGQVSYSVKNRYPRILVGIGISGYRFEVHLTTTHFTCRNESCTTKTFAPKLGIASGKSPFLPAFKDALNKEHFLAKRNNLEIAKDAKSRYQVSISEATLRRMQEKEELETATLVVRIFGIDEIYTKGQKGAHLAIFDLERGIPLGMAKGTRQKDLRRLWKEVESRGVGLSGIRLVLRDLYPHWDKVIQEKQESWLGSKVTIMADPFHLVKRVQSNLYQRYYAPLRKELRAEGKGKESLELFHARWAWRTGEEKLTLKQSRRLTPILNRYRRIEQAWIAKERVRLIYQAGSRKEARRRLAWATAYAQDQGFSEVEYTLRKNRVAILNAFGDCGDDPRREMAHYPEERISQIRLIERWRGAFRKVENLVRNLLIGYQMEGII